MPNTQKATLIIRYMDDTIQKFEFVRDLDAPNYGTKLDKILGAPNLVLEVGDRLLIIPKTNIKSIEATPVPPKLPDTVLRNARLIG